MSNKILIFLRYTCWIIVAFLNTYIISDGLQGESYIEITSKAMGMHVYKDVIWDNVYAIIAACTLFILGIIFGLIVYSMRNHLNHLTKQSLICLCQYIFCSALWILLESHIYEFLTDNLKLIKLLSYICFTAMFTFLFEFFMCMFESKRDLNFVCYSLYILVIVNILNCFIGFTERINILKIVHIVCFIGFIIIGVWAYYYRKRHTSNETKYIIRGFYIMCLIFAVAVIAYYLNDEFVYIISYTVAICVFCFYLSAATLSQVKDTMMEKAHEEIYKRLAYSDEMTGLMNKTAYVEFEKEIPKNGDIIIVTDMNNLKFINDSFGHRIGDDVIIGAAQYLSKYFEKSKVFRFGGDEFVIYTNDTLTNVNETINKMKKEIEKDNFDRQYKIDFAIGIACQKEGDTINSMFMRADQSMYEDKIKKGHHR